MKRILMPLFVLLMILSLGACLKPDPVETSRAVSVSLVDVLETVGYARDVDVHDDMIFVAASQAGIQIWQEQSAADPVLVFAHQFSGDPALRVLVEPESRILFSFDKSGGFHKTLNPELTGFDSVYILQSIWIGIFEEGLFGSGANEDFVARAVNEGLVALYVIDRTSNDGLKQYFFNRRFNPSPAFHYWELNNVGSSTGGVNLGIDLRDNLMAISHDELGIGLYRLDGVNLDTLSTLDTPGEALEVKFFDNYLLSANNWAGMGVFSLGSGDSSLTHMADIEVGGWVKQISLWNDIAILSCGENGIFLVDLSDP
ncbi:MAG: hypothetical protein HQ507_00615, partial [Candidatus Marinimicrobia bacterium]|nr:hypothetical protein [Candidatus Neomarinimicrobiota bacterium]